MEQTEISEGHYTGGSGGTSTSAIIAGGQDSGPSSANTETWDGSSWSEEADLNTGRVEMGGTGPNSEALLVFGGNPGPGLFTKTENFDGTTWAEVADLSTARQNMSSHVGTTSAALAAGGNKGGSPDRAPETEEWTTTPTALFQKLIQGQLYFNSTTNTFKETLKDFVAGTWSSANGLNNGRT